ncbi:MAG: DUF554 domain-containing protein [Ruminococcaceae bacterium]|nr:DUF554 domain-containing protein [Oscillospiraceae bacterium]
MKGIGILVNILACLVGGGFGLMVQGKLRVRYQQGLYRLMGILVLGFGAYELMQHYFVLADGEIELKGSIMVVIALTIGALMGYLFDLTGLFHKIGCKLSQKEKKEKEAEKQRLERLSRAVDMAIEKDMALPKVPWLDRLSAYEMPSFLSKSLYADGFILAWVFLCANSMLLSGVLADGMDGVTTTLLIKSGADFIFCFSMALICGSGVMHAIIPMAFLEGILWLGCTALPELTDQFFAPVLTAQLLVIGAVTLLILGVQMTFDVKKIKAMNFLPAPLVPLLYYGILFILNLFTEK